MRVPPSSLVVASLLPLVLGQGNHDFTRPPNLYYPRSPIWPETVPNTTGYGWQTGFKRAKAFVSQLTTEEKSQICTGKGLANHSNPDQVCQGNIIPIPRLNFSGICYGDSDSGIGNTHTLASGFPPGIHAAATWNKDLIRARAYGICSEFRTKGVHVFLGPVTVLSRYVGGGTNFEGFGVDPYLGGIASALTVQGCQATGVQASPKQYLGYDGQNQDRVYYSSNIDDKTMHEINVWPFAEAVRANPAVMRNVVSGRSGTDDYINNTQACQNSYLLNGILKRQLGFSGYVNSDWFALKSGLSAYNAGTDQDMPGWPGRDAQGNSIPWSYFGGNLTESVNNGSLPEWRLNDMATRILTPYFGLDQDRGFPDTNLLDGPFENTVDAQRKRHQTLIQDIAVAGTVLLKNEQGTLPLWREKKIAVFGVDAGQNPYGPNSYGYGASGPADDFQWSLPGMGWGTLAGGAGSGSTYYAQLIDPLMALQLKAREQMTTIDWTITPNLTATAAMAQTATKCIVFGSSLSGEGWDRNVTLMHDGDAIINAVADNCAKTIVVIHTVGPVDMEKWADHPNVTAIINAGLPGQESGFALTSILYGEVTPSGRLPYTIAKNVADYAQPFQISTPQDYPQINYTEGVLIDYRGLQVRNISTRYPFGHGLSYTTFEYKDLEVTKYATLQNALKTKIEWEADAPGGDTNLFETAVGVAMTVTNAGTFPGTEIVQLYLQLPAEAENPARILRGFEAVDIPVGQSALVKLYLTRKDISYWNVVQQTWVVPTGHFDVYVGTSSQDLRLTGGFDIAAH